MKIRTKKINATFLARRLSKGHTRWLFSTDILNPETDAAGYVFDTGYFIAHGFGFQLAFYWSR